MTVGAAAEEDASKCLFHSVEVGTVEVSYIPFLLVGIPSGNSRKPSQLCCRNRGAACHSPVLSTGRKVDVSRSRSASSNTEFRLASGRDRVANYWQPDRKTDGSSIKFW